MNQPSPALSCQYGSHHQACFVGTPTITSPVLPTYQPSSVLPCQYPSHHQSFSDSTPAITCPVLLTHLSSPFHSCGYTNYHQSSSASSLATTSSVLPACLPSHQSLPANIPTITSLAYSYQQPSHHLYCPDLTPTFCSPVLRAPHPSSALCSQHHIYHKSCSVSTTITSPVRLKSHPSPVLSCHHTSHR